MIGLLFIPPLEKHKKQEKNIFIWTGYTLYVK